MTYKKIPILDTAMRCGLHLNSRTLDRTEVEATCPFCGDHGPGKYHLSLNTEKDLFRCNLCNATGNSVTLYANTQGLTNREAFLELERGSNVYPLPKAVPPQNTERQPKPIVDRHRVYSKMLSYLTLSEKHRDSLLQRGLSFQRIDENQYRSMPETNSGRKLLASLLSMEFDLLGIPGFYTKDGQWSLAGPNGILIPIRDVAGQIQGIKIHLDRNDPGRKYRWLSSRDKNLDNGTRSYSWVHVTGKRGSKRAFLTEGPLKGDVASFLSDDSLFVCIGGINALHGLKDTLIQLGVTEVIEATDMDQMTNPQVRKAVLAMRQEVQSIPKLKYTKYTWNPAFNGIDDYLYSQVA